MSICVVVCGSYCEMKLMFQV